MFRHFKRTKISYFFVVLILISFFALNQGFIHAEEHPQENKKEHKFNKEYLKNFASDFVEVYKSPKRWGKEELKNLTAVLVGGIYLYAIDSDVHFWLRDRRGSTSEDVSNFMTNLGNGGVITAFIASLYASGELMNRDNLRKTALLSLESWVTSGSIVLGIKFIAGRARPKTGESKSTFHPFSSQSSYYSFPSGHSASAFAVASVIADQSEKFAVDCLAYSLATLVAISRIHEDKHWASDVFIGAAIGYFVGKKISALNRNRDSDKFKISFQLSPGKQAIGFSICF